MRATVNATSSSVIVTGAGSYLVRNMTGTAAIYLETVAPPAVIAATEAKGFEWLTTDTPFEITLSEQQALCGIVASGGAEQTLHILVAAAL